MNSIEIGKRIRQIRQENKLTMTAMAEKLEVSDSYWGEIERGKRLLSLEKMVMLLNLFNLSADFVLYGIAAEKCSISSSEALTDLSQQDLQTILDILTLLQEKEGISSKNEYFDQYFFARRLQSYRKKAGLSIKDLAEKTGLHFTQIQKIETCKVVPTLKTLDKIAVALEIPIDNLLANSIPAGKTIIIQEILEFTKSLSPTQQKMAKNITKAILGNIEKSNDK